MSWWTGVFSVPARCLNRKQNAQPLQAEKPGTYATMLGADRNAFSKVNALKQAGWTEVEINLESTQTFFDAKDWCDANVGRLGDDWINVNLRIFLFADAQNAMLFKLTFA
jgi:hypothetical protein